MVALPNPPSRALTAAWPVAVAAALLVTGCGGGGDSGPSDTLSGTAASGAPQVASSGAASGDSTALDAFEKSVLDAVNAARAIERNCGGTAYAAAAAVQWNAQLEDAARAHSEFLQAFNLVSHTGSGGSTPGERATAAGYQWSHVGENIAAGFPDVASAVEAWLDSPGHCANLMNPVYADVGLALQPGTSANQFSSYWTLMLGQAL